MPPLFSKTMSALTISEAQLSHLSSYLSTFSGTDKALMLLQYLPLVILPLFPSDVPKGLPIRRRGAQGVRVGLERLSSVIGDGRILFRLFGLVPILQWYAGLRKKRAAAQKLARKPATKPSSWQEKMLPDEDRIEMIQAYSMLAYYPLEHIYYLASKRIISLRDSTLLKVGVWSCRFWALYVVLSLLSLSRRRLALNRKAAFASVDTSAPDLKKASDTLSLLTTVDLAYLPLTVHWSLSAGAWSSSFPTGVFGTIAALAQLKLGWEGSRPAAVNSTPVSPPAEEEKVFSSERPPVLYSEVVATGEAAKKEE